jgi:hypothetical protein
VHNITHNAAETETDHMLPRSYMEITCQKDAETSKQASSYTVSLAWGCLPWFGQKARLTTCDLRRIGGSFRNAFE